MTTPAWKSVPQSSGSSGLRRQHSVVTFADGYDDTVLSSFRDGTTAIDGALTALQTELLARGGGTIVIPPSASGGGNRLTTKNFAVGPQITLKGRDARPVINRALVETIDDDAPEILFDYAGDAAANGLVFDQGSAIKGLRLRYAQQAAKSAATPVAYNYALAARQDVGQILGASIEDVLLVNAYKGINLTQCGTFHVSHVHGQPLALGMTVDAVPDSSFISHVHWWPYYARTGDALYAWVLANCRGFYWGKADHIVAVKVGGFGMNEGYYFANGTDTANGTWADFYGTELDTASKPIQFAEKVQRIRFFGGYANGGGDGSGLLRQPIVTTGPDVRGSVAFYGTDFYAGRVAAHITSNTGDFLFDDCFDTDLEANGVSTYGQRIKSLPLIVSGAADVEVRSRGTRKVLPLGGGNVKVNGVALPNPDALTGATDFQLTNWSAGTPVGWTGLSGKPFSQITGGIRLGLDPTGGGSVQTNLQFVLPQTVVQRGSVYMAKFDMTVHTSEAQPSYNFEINVNDGAAAILWYAGNQNVAPDCGQDVTVTCVVPVLLSADPSLAQTFRFQVTRTATSDGYIDLTNVGLYRQDAAKTSHAQLALLRSVYGVNRQSIVINNPHGYSALPGHGDAEVTRRWGGTGVPVFTPPAAGAMVEVVNPPEGTPTRYTFDGTRWNYDTFDRFLVSRRTAYVSSLPVLEAKDSQALSSGQQRAVAAWCRKAQTYTKCRLLIPTTFAGLTDFRIGVYDAAGTTKLVESANLSATLNGASTAAPLEVTIGSLALTLDQQVFIVVAGIGQSAGALGGDGILGASVGLTTVDGVSPARVQAGYAGGALPASMAAFGASSFNLFAELLP